MSGPAELTPQARARLDTITRRADELSVEIRALIDEGELPAYVAGAAVFASTEARVLARRLGNLKKVLTVARGPSDAP